VDKHETTMPERHEKMIFSTKCNRNPAYPKARLVCGEVHRIKDPQATPERFVDGDWLLLAYIK